MANIELLIHFFYARSKYVKNLSSTPQIEKILGFFKTAPFCNIKNRITCATKNYLIHKLNIFLTNVLKKM